MHVVGDPSPFRSSTEVGATEIRDRDLPAEFAEALAWTGTEELVGTLAHELGNALNVILNNARFVADGLAADSVVAEDARQIVKSATQAAVLVRHLGLLGYNARNDVQVFGVGTLAADLAPVLREGLGERAHLRVQIDDGLPDVRSNPGALTRALLAVALARRDELDEGATLELRVRVDAASRCVLVVMRGAAVAFDPIRAGARGLATAAGARLEAVPAPAGCAALCLAVPIGGG
jgi:nitrogen-specific signal transduction histidine kinase